MGKFAELYEEEKKREDRIDTRMYIESSEEELKTDVNQIFAEIINDIRVRFNKLNDDDCYKLTLKLKDWFNKNVYN